MFVANRKLLIKDKDGNHICREKGDEVPEAQHWPQIDVWINSGHIIRVDDENGDQSSSDDSQEEPIDSSSPIFDSEKKEKYFENKKFKRKR